MKIQDFYHYILNSFLITIEYTNIQLIDNIEWSIVTCKSVNYIIESARDCSCFVGLHE